MSKKMEDKLDRCFMDTKAINDALIEKAVLKNKENLDISDARNIHERVLKCLKIKNVYQSEYFHYETFLELIHGSCEIAENDLDDEINELLML